MNICIASQGYPYNGYIQNTFVKQLCVEMVRQGHRVIVIAPQSITNMLLCRKPFIPYYRIDKVTDSAGVDVYTPKYISIGNIPIIDQRVNLKTIEHAVSRTLSKIIRNYQIDVCYGHFWHMGLCLYKVCSLYNIPLFVASGESNIVFHRYISESRLKSMIEYVRGVICVSTKNQKESIEKLKVSESKCSVFPNGVNGQLFYNMNRKDEIRASLHYSPTDFIIAFTGAFTYRKGYQRLAQALREINDKSIKVIFIGTKFRSSDPEPQCNGILFSGQMSHEKIPLYLNSADVFVLPTLAEGCCNAIVEALSCGLPVISSDKNFNYDILDDTCSILIDPLNVEQIKKAICSLKDNSKLLNEKKMGALHKASNLTIEKRVASILLFISNRI